MSKFKRMGFTLAEMLLVIAIIGVLSGMMMIASGESVKTTEANNIINNLRNIASAALTFYTDNMDYFTSTPTTSQSEDLAEYVKKYMYSGGSTVLNTGSSYYVKNDKSNGTWWAGYAIPSGANSEGIKSRLEAKAASSNLKGANQNNSNNALPIKNGNDYPNYDKTFDTVWLMIRSSTN